MEWRTLGLALPQRLAGRRPLRLQRLRPFRALAILGPGLIAATAGNDAGGNATYSAFGARFGYTLLWALPLIAVSLGLVQEMAARLGAVTGKGLAELIREEFGVRWATLAMLTLLVANGGTTIAEFAGIAAAVELFGISKYLAVPLAAVLVWAVVVGPSYQVAERVFLGLASALLTYVLAAFLAGPDWPIVGRSLVTPTFQLDPDFLVAFITLIGTTITPYMQFFQQSAVVDKGINAEEYPRERLDVLIGVGYSILVAFFIMVATATTLHPAGIVVDSAADAARALAPLAGPYATVLFGVGLLGASLLAASVLPLSTAYAICGAFGWERSVSAGFERAPIFNGLYTALIAIGALVALVPGLPLIGVIIGTQFLNGLLLPIVLLFIVRLVRRPEIMGRHVNGPLLHGLAWASTLLVIGLSGTLLVRTLFPGLLG